MSRILRHPKKWRYANTSVSSCCYSTIYLFIYLNKNKYY